MEITHLCVCVCGFLYTLVRNIYKPPKWSFTEFYQVCPTGQEEEDIRLNGVQYKAKERKQLFLCMWPQLLIEATEGSQHAEHPSARGDSWG